MHRSRVKYVIEIVIHALFWLGVYYALKSLTGSSYSMVIERGNVGIQRMDVRLLFPYSGIVLGSLILLFYSYTFWLFKKVIRYKSAFPGVVVIAGWLVLLFAANYLVIRTLIGPSGRIHLSQNADSLRVRDDTARLGPPQTKVFFESRSDTASLEASPNLASHGFRSDTAFLRTPSNRVSPGIPPPFVRSPVDNWLHTQLVMALIFLSVLAIA